jgi:putative inorganic carbon (hco3(-)) transporter
MAKNAQHYASRGLLPPASGDLFYGAWANKAALVLGILAAGAAGLFVTVHWTIAVLGGVAVVLLSIAESEAFLLFAIFLMPLGWTLQWNVPVRDVSVAFRSLVIVGFFLGRFLRGQLGVRRLLHPVLTQASLLFLCVAIASALLGSGGLTLESARALWALFTSVGFYFVVLSWADSPQRIRRILRVLLYSTIITAAFAILQEIVGDYTSFWLFLHPPQDLFAPMEYRAPSFFANCNFLAGYLNLVVPFSLACWVLWEGRWKRLGAWTTGFGVAALLCTQSLGGLVSFGGVVLLAILCFVENWKTKLALFAAVCALVIAFYFAMGILNPAHEGTSFAYDQAIRLVLWGIAWDFFRYSPILGVGWGNFVVLYGSYVANISWIPAGQFEVHNLYLQLLAETGLIGFGAFSLLIFRAVQQALRQLRCSVHALDKAIAFGVLGAIVTVLMHGFVDFFFQVSPQFSTLFWVLLALLVADGKTVAGGSCGDQEVRIE